jgi:hypothetical protein
MNIYKVERTDDRIDYDETAAYVVVARDEHAARVWGVTLVRGRQPGFVWLANSTQVTLLGTSHLLSGTIVLTDFHAG